MNCPEALRVQAYFDGELDANEVSAVLGHLEGCERCRSLLADLDRGRNVLRRMPDIAAPPELRTRIGKLLDVAAEPPAAKARSGAWSFRAFWLGAFAGLGAAALAASAILLVLLPAASSPLLDGLLAAHLSSLTPDHLISVASSERHTVKPWFAGRADVSPTVRDFAPQGFVLAGGRVDALPGARAAVMVYRRGRHVINVFTWPDTHIALPRDTTRNGYHMLFWRVGDVAYCAVSDTGWAELGMLAGLVQAQAATEQQPAQP
jgi:anti-sigma factor RsiW